LGAATAGAIVGGAIASDTYYGGYPYDDVYAYGGCGPYGGCYPSGGYGYVYYPAPVYGGPVYGGYGYGYPYRRYYYGW
jgi:hypothetical protein